MPLLSQGFFVFTIWQNSCSQFKTTKCALITFADPLGDEKLNRMLIFNS